MLNDDYDGGKKLIPRFPGAPPNKGTWGVESLLAEQIMFCKALVNQKRPFCTFYVVTGARAIHPPIPGCNYGPCPGKLQLDELLSMPDYDFHRVALLIDELQDAIDVLRMKPIKIRYFVEGH